VKTENASAPLVLVGGGALLVDVARPIAGVSEVLRPQHFDAANAVGAALAQVQPRARRSGCAHAAQDARLRRR
jgi:hypothetical protein